MTDRKGWDTVYSIMAPDLIWGSPGDDFVQLGHIPSLGEIDQIPVRKNGNLEQVAVRDGTRQAFNLISFTGDMVVSSSTPIGRLFFVDWTNSAFLFVLDENKICGIVTPSDLNKTPVHAALYRILAEFESQVTKKLDLLPTTDERLATVASDWRKNQSYHAALIAEGFDLSKLYVLGIEAKLTLLKSENPALGFSSDQIDAIKDIRDRVAHHKPIVVTTAEILKVKATLETIQDLSNRL